MTHTAWEDTPGFSCIPYKPQNETFVAMWRGKHTKLFKIPADPSDLFRPICPCRASAPLFCCKLRQWNIDTFKANFSNVLLLPTASLHRKFSYLMLTWNMLPVQLILLFTCILDTVVNVFGYRPAGHREQLSWPHPALKVPLFCAAHAWLHVFISMLWN